MADRLVYRLILGAVAVARDFQSMAERGDVLRPPVTARRQRLHAGVSVYDSLDAAFARQRQLQPEHHAIAVLVLTAEDHMPIEQTGANAHHFTIWASVEALRDRVHWMLIVTRIGAEPA